MFESLWNRLDDQELGEKIRERPEMFLGTRGYEGLQAMMLGGVNSLVQAPNFLQRAQLNVSLEEDKVTLSIALGEEDDFSNWGVERNVISFTNLAVIRNLSTRFKIEVHDNKHYYLKEYAGLRQTADEKKETVLEDQTVAVEFIPDYRLFGFRILPYYLYYDYCQQLAMLNSGLIVQLKETDKQQNLFYYPDGLVTYISAKDDFLGRKGKTAHFTTIDDNIRIEIAVSRNDQARVSDSFANNERTFSGGTHLDGFLEGAITALNQFLEEQNNVGYYNEEKFCSRFDFAISVHVPVPKYVGVTKQKLRNQDVFSLVKEFIEKEFLIHLRRFPLWYRG